MSEHKVLIERIRRFPLIQPEILATPGGGANGADIFQNLIPKINIKCMSTSHRLSKIPEN